MAISRDIHIHLHRIPRTSGAILREGIVGSILAHTGTGHYEPVPQRENTQREREDMNDFLKNLERIAPLVPPAYRIHLPVGSARLHVFAARSEGQRIWQAANNKLVENAENAYYRCSLELHEILVNSLFTATEVHAIAQYFIEKDTIEIAVTPQPFPVPLPYHFLSLDFSQSQDDPLITGVGDLESPPPAPFLAFLFDTIGIFSEVWEDNLFAQFFSLRSRLEIKSAAFSPGKDELPLEFSIHAYEECYGICIFEELIGVHNHFESYRESDFRRL